MSLLAKSYKLEASVFYARIISKLSLKIKDKAPLHANSGARSLWRVVGQMSALMDSP